MAESIEAFVAKLQQEGVEAGRQQADQLRIDAEKQAEQIVREAQEQAETIVSEAEAKAENIMERSRAELALAGRDAIGRLREAIGRAIRDVLSREVGEQLRDADFLGKLIHDVVVQYAQADAAGETVDINVSREMGDKLADWSVAQLSGGEGNISPELRAELTRAGFEYSADDATVEVTTESVVAMLDEMLSPRMRELLDEAAAKARQQATDGDQAQQEQES